MPVPAPGWAARACAGDPVQGCEPAGSVRACSGAAARLLRVLEHPPETCEPPVLWVVCEFGSLLGCGWEGAMNSQQRFHYCNKIPSGLSSSFAEKDNIIACFVSFSYPGPERAQPLGSASVALCETHGKGPWDLLLGEMRSW